MIPTLIIVGADKGGVGKTMSTRVLLDYLARRGVSRRAFDAQWPGGDLKRFAIDAELVDFSKVEGQMKVLDGVGQAGVTVIDLPAGLLSPTLAQLDAAQLLADVRAGRLGLVLLHVLGPTVSSIGEIAAAAAKIGSGVRHVLVKNHVNDTKFGIVPAEQLARFAATTVNVPQLVEAARAAIEDRGRSFADFVNDPSQSRLLRGLVSTWLDQVWTELDRVHLGDALAPVTANPT